MKYSAYKRFLSTGQEIRCTGLRSGRRKQQPNDADPCQTEELPSLITRRGKVQNKQLQQCICSIIYSTIHFFRVQYDLYMHVFLSSRRYAWACWSHHKKRRRRRRKRCKWMRTRDQVSLYTGIMLVHCVPQLNCACALLAAVKLGRTVDTPCRWFFLGFDDVLALRVSTNAGFVF